MPETITKEQPRECSARACPHCHHHDKNGGVTDKPRPLTPADLDWHFGVGEALGLKSTHGAIVDMANSGIQDGSRSNGVENRMAHVVRVRNDEDGEGPVSKHRCLRSRLLHVAPAHLAVLRAAYGPDDWTRTVGDREVKAAVDRALRLTKATPGACRVLPLTQMARAHAARRQATTAAAKAYRSPAPTEGAAIAHKLRAYLAEQPGLAGTAQGAVLSAACSEDKTRLLAMVREAVELVARACAVAGVTEGQRPPSRIRSHHKPLPSLVPALVLEA